jgi:diguanylate cyclase (GGDEF)-like protein
MRILIAEDDFTSRAVLAGVLKKSGHDVVETVNGAAAWDALRQPDAPRLVILDWMMPEMDGLEVVRLVRALQTDQPPYIIMLTARGEKADIITGLDAGPNDYLAKPFDPGEFHARVEVGRRMVELQAELLAAKNALAHEAMHDPLTGVQNRRAIFDALRKELIRTEREKLNLSIGLCDIDHFKQVNDRYGHQVGDEVLCAFVRTIQDRLRGYDLVGRYGGEEFLVVAPDSTGLADEGIYERLRAEIAGLRMATRAGEVCITVSIGVAGAGDGTTVDTMVEAADTALYRAKEAGRNRVCYASK